MEQMRTVNLVAVALLAIVAAGLVSAVNTAAQDPGCTQDLGPLFGAVTREEDWLRTCRSVHYGGYSRYYSFTLHDSAVIEISMTTQRLFVSRLALWTGAGTGDELVKVDTYNFLTFGQYRGHVHRISLPLPAGTYTIEAMTDSFFSHHFDLTTSVEGSGGAPGLLWTDPRIVPGVTPVRAAHLTELRRQVDAARLRCGLGNIAWIDPDIRPGVTPIKAVHITQLRAASDANNQACSQMRPAWTDPQIVPGVTPVRAVHFAELRDAVLALYDAAGGNQAPEPVGAIPTQTLTEGGHARSVDVARYFRDPDGIPLAYSAVSAHPGTVAANTSGSVVTLTPVVAGTTTVGVTASDGSLSAMQTISVWVVPPLPTPLPPPPTPTPTPTPTPPPKGGVGPPPPPPPPPPRSPRVPEGKVVFWTDARSGWSRIDISAGLSSHIGSLTRSLDSPPNCDVDDAARVVYTNSPGDYTYQARSGAGHLMWNGTVRVVDRGCRSVRLGCGSDRTCSSPPSTTPPPPPPTPPSLSECFRESVEPFVYNAAPAFEKNLKWTMGFNWNCGYDVNVLASASLHWRGATIATGRGSASYRVLIGGTLTAGLCTILWLEFGQGCDWNNVAPFVIINEIPIEELSLTVNWRACPADAECNYPPYPSPLSTAEQLPPIDCFVEDDVTLTRDTSGLVTGLYWNIGLRTTAAIM